VGALQEGSNSWKRFMVLIPDLELAMKTDGNGRKNHISTSVSIFFGGNGIGFGKYGFENRIGICGHTETNKYGWRAGKLN
jgi:hypothetical protein